VYLFEDSKKINGKQLPQVGNDYNGSIALQCQPKLRRLSHITASIRSALCAGFKLTSVQGGMRGS
jgi:hypothetical protein